MGGAGAALPIITQLPCLPGITDAFRASNLRVTSTTSLNRAAEHESMNWIPQPPSLAIAPDRFAHATVVDHHHPQRAEIEAFISESIASASTRTCVRFCRI
jgi:hypothetical protein